MKKQQIVECEYCGNPFTKRGISRHQSKCSQTRCKAREFRIPGLDTNALSVVASFLSNQTIVKMQLVTGGRFPGSSIQASAICCPCENDEFAIANGRCLACNTAKNPKFRQTISTTQARRLYGIKDIDGVPHKVRGWDGDKYCKHFKHSDLQKYAISLFKTKCHWLEMVARKQSWRTKMKDVLWETAEQYRANMFEAFIEKVKKDHRIHSDNTPVTTKAQAKRYDIMVKALTQRDIETSPSVSIRNYVLYDIGDPDEISNLMAKTIKRREANQQLLSELPREFVAYLGHGKGRSPGAIRSQHQRYNELLDKLAEHDLELREDNALCRRYILHRQGGVDEILHAMVETKRLFGYA